MTPHSCWTRRTNLFAVLAAVLVPLIVALAPGARTRAAAPPGLVCEMDPGDSSVLICTGETAEPVLHGPADFSGVDTIVWDGVIVSVDAGEGGGPDNSGPPAALRLEPGAPGKSFVYLADPEAWTRIYYEAMMEAVGVAISGSQFRFESHGDIRAEALAENATAVGLTAEGDGLVLSIHGDIDADADNGGSAVGLQVRGRDMRISIGTEGDSVDVSGIAFGTGSHGVGLAAFGTGEIYNYGWVLGRISDEDTEGMAIGALLVAAGGELSLYNAGELQADDSDPSFGARLVAIDGADGSPAVVRLENAGTIWTTSRPPGHQTAAVSVGTGNAEQPMGDIIIINEETGWIYGASGYINEGSHERYVSVSVAHPEQAYRSLTLVNHGTLIGDVILGSGPNFVELGPESSTWGDVFLGTGDSVVTLWAGAYVDGAIRGEGRTNRLVVQAGPPGEEPEIHWAEWFIEGFNAFEIASGHWVFPEGIGGRLRNGETLIRRGAALELDGIAELDLETGAVLAGNGTFIGDVTNWEGSVRPGESIGTLTIVGDYTHDADAVLDIEVDPSKPAGDPEEADLLYVTGKATIHGGKVQVTLLGPATYVSGQRDFTILKADGGVEGAFDEMDVGGELSPFLEFALSHLGPDSVTGADEVIFTIIKKASFSSVAETPNQKEVAGALDDMADGAPPDDMVTVLGELQTLDEDAARDALDRMSGEIYTWHGRLAQQAADGVARSVRSGRIPLTRGEDRLWFAQDANVVVLAGDKAYAGGQARTFAFTSGYALLQRDSGARLGVFGTLMSTDAAMPRRGSAMTGSGWALGVYGRYAGSWGYVDGLAAYGSSGYHATRDVTVGSEARRAEGSFGATVAAAAADAAFRPFDTPLGRAEITAGLTWMSSARPQVKETGAGSLSLLVDPGEDHSLRAHAGVRLWTEQTQTLLGLGAQPWFHLGWVQELSPSPRTVTARLQGLPDHAMTIGGAETPAGLLRLGAGVTFAWDDDPDASIHVQYTGEFASGVKDHALTVQGSIRF